MEEAMPTTADAGMPMHQKASLHCEDGGVQHDVSQRKKWTTYFALIATFVAAMMLGFFIVGPLCQQATAEIGAARRSNDQFLSKSFFVGNAVVSPKGASRASVSMGFWNQKHPEHFKNGNHLKKLAVGACLGACLTAGQLQAPPAFAAAPNDPTVVKYKLPPIDRTNMKERCKFATSKMGQANAARDKLFDLRECKMEGQSAESFDISGVLMADGDFSKGNFKEAQLSKAYVENAKFDDSDFTNGVIDRVAFKGASVRGAIFTNAVLSGSNFDGADVENADFTNAYLDMSEQRKLCKNPTLKGENPKTGASTIESAGCVGKYAPN